MRKIGFDNEKYIKLQSESIYERVKNSIDYILNLVANYSMTITHQEYCQALCQILRSKCF